MSDTETANAEAVAERDIEAEGGDTATTSANTVPPVVYDVLVMAPRLTVDETDCPAYGGPPLTGLVVRSVTGWTTAFEAAKDVEATIEVIKEGDDYLANNDGAREVIVILSASWEEYHYSQAYSLDTSKTLADIMNDVFEMERRILDKRDSTLIYFASRDLVQQFGLTMLQSMQNTERTMTEGVRALSPLSAMNGIASVVKRLLKGKSASGESEATLNNLRQALENRPLPGLPIKP